ncbi:hypothetical protein AB9P05_24820 [Roseivirga sp. BDSF3-8]|uniref:hypothetical protein n=1 Tax=Roseivirga sp. BDSF3-8 TaxID=3241598 RepID=UPI0035322809
MFKPHLPFVALIIFISCADHASQVDPFGSYASDGERIDKIERELHPAFSINGLTQPYSMLDAA